MFCTQHVAQFPVDTFRRTSERHFAERRQVFFAKKILGGRSGAVADVNLALRQPLPQPVRCDVNQLDIVGLVEHGIRHGFANGDAGELLDEIVPAFEMLDVESGININAGIEQFEDILVAFGVP